MDKKKARPKETKAFNVDEKPKLTLSEFEIYDTSSNNVSGNIHGDTNQKYDIKQMSSKLQIKVVTLDKLDMTFDLIGFDPAIVNALRRILLSDVPSMAIEKIHMWQNTSIMQDEVLAHRLGLIPLTADPRQFTYPGPGWSPETGTERDTLEFSLEVRCTKDPDTPGQFVDSHVLTDKLVWVPRGEQASWLTDPGPQQKDILINKLRPGHEMEIKLFAVKGLGRDHAKFSPVATVFYRLMPHIEIKLPVLGEDAVRLQKCFSPGVIEVVDGEKGKGGRGGGPETRHLQQERVQIPRAGGEGRHVENP
uniref:DNA-directed RNA polymerase n=1 Tax=Paracalanus parvus TaxID=187406 RepID=A0A0U2VA63_9MAXI|nr:DNA-directed RNA polymerase [Paracalanus parvus]